MSRRLVIPVEDTTGIDAHLSQHFGQAPYFAVVDLDEKSNVLKVATEPNRGEHVGGTGHPHEHLMALKPDVFVVKGMGPGCLTNLVSNGIMVLKATGTTVKETITSFKEGKLSTLEAGCEHSHHHHH
jgi:predicted Fe-Mo cluster-binding NifX family protein